ncbi:MAG: hypothetical protein PUB73_06380 [Bacteroidales bacterium]|nr:hypothetical protein [Bacteroidales bacterium]
MKELFTKIGAWFKKVFRWLGESNRPKHLLVGFLVSLLLGFNAGFAAGCAAEYKDWAHQGKQHGIHIFKTGSGWDWLDLAATAIGSILGGLIWSITLRQFVTVIF